MDVQLTDDLQAKLNELAARSGRTPDELVRDAVAGLVDDLTAVGDMLDRRYDDFVSGRVEGVPGEQVFADIRRKSAARRAMPRS